MDEFEVLVMAGLALLFFKEEEAADKLFEMFAEKVTK